MYIPENLYNDRKNMAAVGTLTEERDLVEAGQDMTIEAVVAAIAALGEPRVAEFVKNMM